MEKKIDIDVVLGNPKSDSFEDRLTWETKSSHLMELLKDAKRQAKKDTLKEVLKLVKYDYNQLGEYLEESGEEIGEVTEKFMKGICYSLERKLNEVE